MSSILTIICSLFEKLLTNSNLRAMILYMELKEELKVVTGRKKRFLLFRIIDVELKESLKLCGLTQGTYNSWLHNEEFAALYRKRAELAVDFKAEALQMLRRDNQLQAVLLEEKIIGKMTDEINSGEYRLLKTQLGREVYSKLIADLDATPKTVNQTWEQRIEQLNVNNQPPERIPESTGESGVINGVVIQTVEETVCQ